MHVLIVILWQLIIINVMHRLRQSTEDRKDMARCRRLADAAVHSTAASAFSPDYPGTIPVAVAEIPIIRS